MLSAHHECMFISDWNDSPPMETAPSASASASTSTSTSTSYQRRALRIWPGLDRSRLRRAHGDPWKIASLVEARTSLTMEAVLVLLMGPEIDARVPRGQAHEPAPADPG